MSRHVNAIAGRLSLRAPQRRSLEILDRITEIMPLGKGTGVTAVDRLNNAIAVNYDARWFGGEVWRVNISTECTQYLDAT